MIDICIANAFALHKLFGGSKSFQELKLTLVKEIILEATCPDWYNNRSHPHRSPTPLSLQGWHFPEKIQPEQSAKKQKPQKRCAVCYEKGRRKEIVNQCDCCGIPLCIEPCFKAYHTKSSY